MILYLHPKGMGKETRRDICCFISMFYSLRVRSAHKEFLQNFRGSWEGWVEDIFKRKNAMTGDPIYTMVCLDLEIVGKANGAIIQTALSRNIPVHYWCADKELWFDVEDINPNVESTDWTDLYRIKYG